MKLLSSPTLANTTGYSLALPGAGLASVAPEPVDKPVTVTQAPEQKNIAMPSQADQMESFLRDLAQPSSGGNDGGTSGGDGGFARGGFIPPRGLGNPRYPMHPYQAARMAAQQGRGGDNIMVHMRPQEVRGLEAMTGRKM